MNRTTSSRRHRAFTMVEMAISLGIMVTCGGMIFSALRTVMLLSAKTSSVNLTHQQSREMIHKAVQQIHSSISIPALADASFASVSGNGPAAGVTYQTLYGGPYLINTGAAAGTNIIRIASKSGDPAPQVGLRLILPAFQVEDDITAVASLGGSPPIYSITLAHNISSTITCANGTPNYIAYYTQRAALVMVGQTLRHYPNTASSTYSEVAFGITSATPFTVPAGDNRFVQANFEIHDARTDALKLKSLDSTLQLTVPYRYRLTTYQ